MSRCRCNWRWLATHSIMVVGLVVFLSARFEASAVASTSLVSGVSTSPVSAEPGTYSCMPATAANLVTPPPPIWEGPGGRPPTSREVAFMNTVTPLCQHGDVPSAIHLSGVAVPPESTPVSESSKAGTNSTETTSPPSYGGRDCQSGGCYWYVQNAVEKKAIGMYYTTNVSDPPVSTFSLAHSIDQLAVGSGAGGNTYTVEAGWDVDPGAFDSTTPHFFTYANRNQYKGEGDCYDCEFVPATEAKIVPGETLRASSEPMTIGVEYWEGNWWIWVNTQWVGYIHGSFWGGKFTVGETENDYGEIFDRESDPISHMGDGFYGSNSNATTMSQILVIYSNGTEETTGYHPSVTDSSLYSAGEVNSEQTEWHFGGPGLDSPGYAGSSPSALYDPETGRNVFYKGSNGAMWEWVVQGGLWELVELAKASYGSSNETITSNSSPASVDEPGATGRNAFYVGSGGKIWQWWVHEKQWENVELAKVSNGVTNESAAENTSPSAVYEPSGSDRNVFYIGANGKIWQWWTNGSYWENTEIAKASNGGTNESVAANTSPAAVYEPSGSGRNVFYVGANGKIWQWWVNGNHWENVELAKVSRGGTNESVATGTSPTAVVSPSNEGRNIFYVGVNGKIWQWVVQNGAWEDVELGKVNNSGVNESVEGGTSPTSINDTASNGPNVFYTGGNGKVWQWVIQSTGGTAFWEDAEVAKASRGTFFNESVQLGTSPTAVDEPNGTGRNVFYLGENEVIWQWWPIEGGWESFML